MSAALLYLGDARETLANIQTASVRCCVTSPPYWGLRDYGVAGQMGSEASPQSFVAELVTLFREVRRTLTKDGTLWLNMGDSYVASRGGSVMPPQTLAGGTHGKGSDGGFEYRGRQRVAATNPPHRQAKMFGLKQKNLVGMPWRLALALQDDGWYLRSDIIWSKPNPMPEPVRGRPTKSHEYLFLLAKSSRYFYDALGASEPVTSQRGRSGNKARKSAAERGATADGAGHLDSHIPWTNTTGRRNALSVWTIPTQAYKGAHFATFPEELARRCIVIGSARGDVVLDPFLGSGTTAAVAVGLGRRAIGCELNAEYLELARERIGPILCQVVVP